MKKYVIGIDYGTLSARALLLDLTTGEETAVFDESESSHIDLAIALYRIFYGIPGFGKRWRIQNDHIKLFSLLFQFRKKFKHITAYKFHRIFQTV